MPKSFVPESFTLALTLLLVVPTVAGAGTVIEVSVVHASSTTAAETSRLSIQGHDLRMDQMAADGTPKTTMIFHGEAGEMLAIDHARRETTVIDRATVERLGESVAGMKEQMEQAMANVPPEQRQMMEQMMKQRMQGMGQTMSSGPAIEVRATGETGTAGDWGWTKWEAWRGDTKSAEFLVTKVSDLGIDTADFEAFEEMASFFREMLDSFSASSGMRLPMDNPFAELGKVGGFPVVTRRFEGGRMVEEATVRSVESRGLADDLFADPGYPRRTLDMPGR